VSLTRSAPPLRVLIAEDAVLLRESLRRLLTEAGLDVAGTAADAAQLLEQADVQEHSFRHWWVKAGRRTIGLPPAAGQPRPSS
jgi:CheY-like chemotaxis protein